MSFVKEFKAFVNKGNVIDLAVAVVLGAAFSKIVTAIVGGIFMPIVSVFLPDGDWQKWKIWRLQVGSVLAASIDFIVMALVIFVVVNKVMKIKQKEAAAPVEPPISEEVVLLREIRDALKTRPL